MSIKAYKVIYRHNRDFDSVVLAHTRGRAKHKAWLAVNEAGWRPTYEDLTVRRAPEFDSLASKIRSDIAVSFTSIGCDEKKENN